MMMHADRFGTHALEKTRADFVAVLAAAPGSSAAAAAAAAGSVQQMKCSGEVLP
jgi:hypothetical protein